IFVLEFHLSTNFTLQSQKMSDIFYAIINAGRSTDQHGIIPLLARVIYVETANGAVSKFRYI
ncbi:MAG TPA: hypothetical protein VLM80_06100, partial [Anaerolineales bacterium]|nr:hypothetical protein [Anaerolineales bacterium]